MSVPIPARPALSRALVLPLVAALYFVAGKLSLQLAFVNPSASAVWPTAGLALAAVLLAGRRVWPAIFAGAFLVNLTTAGSALTSLGIAGGNTLEALFGAWLVERYARGLFAFERPRDVFRFAALAPAASTMLSASFGVASLALGGLVEPGRVGAVWLTWWLGDMAGELVVTPLLVLWANDPRPPRMAGRAAEAVALAGLLFAVSLAVFNGSAFLTVRYPLEFVAFPILVWAAFRFGPRATITASFTLSVIAIWGTLRGFGPFAREAPNLALLLLQARQALITLMALAMAAAVLDERRSRAEARAAHELRTPLTIVLGLVETLAAYRGQLSEAELLEHCRMIEQQGERVRRLISGLINLSRAEQGMLSLELKPVALADSVKSALTELPPAEGARVAVTLPERIAAIADPVLLDDILVNLLSNAYRYGGREVSITASEHAGQVRLVVSDDGRGVPQEMVPWLFAPFARGSQHRHAEGSGLGLALVKGLAQALGGDAAYEPGLPGARFVISLRSAT